MDNPNIGVALIEYVQVRQLLGTLACIQEFFFRTLIILPLSALSACSHLPYQVRLNASILGDQPCICVINHDVVSWI